MRSKPNTCVECGEPTNGVRCKSCAMRKRFSDERSALIPPNPTGKCFCGCGGTTPIASATRIRKGYVRGEHTCWVMGHQSRKEYRQDTGGALYVAEDRGHDTPCWIWQGQKNQAGYALKRRGKGHHRVHREMYEERFGPIPEGLVADHLCRQRECVNPEHIEPVTIGENVRRGVRYRRKP